MKKLVMLAIVGLASCKQQTANNDTTFDWLEGKWEAQTKEGKFFEYWSREDGDLVAYGGGLVKNDTVFKEYIKLMKIKNYWCYIPVVGKQQPIIFALKENKDGFYLFQNKEHDFPQNISYKVISPDEVKVSVDGIIDSALVTEDYDLIRVK